MENNYPCLSSSFFKDCYIEPIVRPKPQDFIKPFKEPEPAESKQTKEGKQNVEAELRELKEMVMELKEVLERKDTGREG